MTELPYPLLVILIVLAVIAGLWVGGRANDQLETTRKGKDGKTLGARAREAATKGVVSLWKWNRQRQRRRPDKSPDETPKRS